MTPGAKRPMPSPSHFFGSCRGISKVKIRAQPAEEMPEDEPDAPLEEMDQGLEIASFCVTDVDKGADGPQHLSFPYRQSGWPFSLFDHLFERFCRTREAFGRSWKSEFFVRVAENAHHRLSPTALTDFLQQVLFTKGLEGHRVAAVAIEQNNGKWRTLASSSPPIAPWRQIQGSEPLGLSAQRMGSHCAAVLAYIKEIDLTQYPARRGASRRWTFGRGPSPSSQETQAKDKQACMHG